MLIGQKEAETGIITCRPSFSTKQGGFTLVEILVVAAIMVVLFGALSLTLTVGDLSSSVTQAKTDLQAKVRSIMNLLVIDVRDTNLRSIDDNSPAEDYLKFKKIIGNDDTTPSVDPLFAPNFIEYSYNATLLQLRRSFVNDAGTVLQTRVFENITNTTFATDETGVFDNILTSGKLIITIAAQGQAEGARRLPLNFTLTEEVKIRNE